MNKKIQPILTRGTKLLQGHREFFFSLALTLLSALVFWVILFARFETNDDVGMAAIIYGYQGEFTSRMVFINVLMGYLMEACLTVIPQLPWYTLFQCGLLMASFGTMLYLIFCRFQRWTAVFAASMLLIFFGYQCFTLVQFSKTAGAAVIAGILLMFHAWTHRRRWWFYALAGALILAGSMYRFSVFEMLLIPLAGVGLFLLIPLLKQRSWKDILRLCIPFVVVFALCFGCKIFDTWSYQYIDNWNEYLQFNSLRAELLDYGFPDYEENIELYNSLGISERDLTLYKSWEFADPEVFTIEAMEQLVAAKPPRTPATLSTIWSTLGIGLLYYSFLPATLIVLLLGLLWGKKQSLLLLGYEVLAFCGVQIYLFLRGRYLVSRVDISLFLAVFLVLVLYTWELAPKLQRRLGLVLSAAALFVSLPYMVSTQSQAPSIQASAQNSQDTFELISSDPSHLYLVTGLPTDLSLFHIESQGSRSNWSQLGGWKTHSPIMQSVWDRFGVTNPFRNMVDNPDIYYLCNSNIDLRLDYIHNHYSPSAYACVVKLIGEDTNYPLYRIVTGEPQLDWTEAEDATDELLWDFSYTWSENNLSFDGYLYQSNTNSFATSIYIGLEFPDGEQHTYYVTQREDSSLGDLNNGSYGAFGTFLGFAPPQGSKITLFLETEDALYSVDAGLLAA